MRLEATGVASTIGLVLALSACSSEPNVDPLAVTNSAQISNIQDNTATGFYTVDSARLTTTGLGTELTLEFSILNSNGIKFNPVSTITFADGTVLTCEPDDLRRVPSLVESTTSWDFACDAMSFPEDADEATLTVVDSYN